MAESLSSQVGVDNLHIAIMTQEETKTTAAVYETPVYVSQTISLNFQPQSSSTVLYADDGPADTENANGTVNVELNLKSIPLAIRAKLLGAEYDAAKGVFTHKSSNNPPYIALMFKSKKSDGNYRYVCLYKGKAAQPQENYQTKTDTATFNTPTLSLQFIRRANDNVDYRYADEPTFTGGSTFFDSVYEPAKK